MASKRDMIKTLTELSIQNGDIVLVHSSLKSIGHMEGGAEAVVESFLEAVGKDGTLVMPTLSQKDWEHIYETWNMDKPSDVGLITETFRKMPGVYRSDQATHSVAAYGKMADQITKEHTAYGLRRGPFGDTAFCRSSPWQKMYEADAKIVFLGVSMKYNTMKHLAEHIVMEELVEKEPSVATRVRQYGDEDGKIWPYLDGENLQREFESKSMVGKSVCGNATLLSISSRGMIDLIIELLKYCPDKYISNERRNGELIGLIKGCFGKKSEVMQC